MISINLRNAIAMFFFLTTVFLYDLSYASVAVNNTSTYRGEGRWDWTIYIDADETTLAQIDCVEYTLHPTFSNPVKKACQKKNKFALSIKGWGTFLVKVKVIYKNNDVEELEHMLVFDEETVVSDTNIGTENWSRKISEGWWEWGVKIHGDNSALDKVRCVEYKLHKSFRNPVRNICSRENDFELKAKGWGTFSIPIKVLFKDDTVLNLVHELTLGE